MYVFSEGVRRYAELLVDYSVAVKKGDEVFVSAELGGIPLVRELVRAIVSRGAYVTTVLRDEVVEEYFYRYASEEQLSHVSPVTRVLYEEYDVRISILAPLHTKHLATIDPSKQALRRRALRPYTERFLREAAEGRKRWVVAAYPTPAMAQEAGMTIAEFEDFVYRAVKLHHSDPVEAWREQARRQERVIEEVLGGVDELRFEGPGIDLTVKVGGRRWVNDDGVHNMPGGEVFTGPVEDGVWGCVRFDYPAVYAGREVEGVKLCFREGRVVEYDAVKGRDFLEKMLGLDEGARRLGELAFGLNYDIDRATKEILFDEKIGGTIHMALGAGYPETGSQNRSAIHWDMVKDMRSGEARVYADGELVYQAGRFLAWGAEE